jgi:hypothetical protein
VILIQFCHDEELNLLIPYEYQKGILSTERMKEIASDLLKLSETLTNEEIDQINQRDKAEQIAILKQQHQEFLRLPKGRKPKSGVVYLLQAKGTNRYKIGCTTNLKTRLNSLRTKNPYELEVIHTISSNDIEALEKAAHDQFAQYRTHSEWFELTEGAVMEFCSYVDGTAA